MNGLGRGEPGHVTSLITMIDKFRLAGSRHMALMVVDEDYLEDSRIVAGENAM